MQARALEAVISRFDPETNGFNDAWNPVSPLYGGRMVDPARIHIWAWDARPWPAFPQLEDEWSDGPLWHTGHWLNGRIDGVDLDHFARILCERALPAPDVEIRTDTRTFVDGYVIDRPVSVRAAIEPLASMFSFDGAICGGAIGFYSRAGAAVHALTEADLVPGEAGELAAFSRGQDSELPRRLSLSFYDGERDYRPASVHARRIEGASSRETAREAAVVISRAQAQQRCDVLLQDVWIARETARFSLRPGRLDLEIGDLVSLPGANERVYRIVRLNDGPVREVEAHSAEPAIYDHSIPALARVASAPVPLAGPLQAHVFSLGLTRAFFELNESKGIPILSRV